MLDGQSLISLHLKVNCGFIEVTAVWHVTAGLTVASSISGSKGVRVKAFAVNTFIKQPATRNG